MQNKKDEREWKARVTAVATATLAVVTRDALGKVRAGSR
jgi:hypothetical protein